MYGCIFLDLFSGSGGIGIEALSRGAREAVFVENNPKAMACIKENLKFTKLEHKAATMTMDVMNALYNLEGDKVFDFIFMDPPYDRGLERKVLEYLSGSGLIYEDTVIIAEASNWILLLSGRKHTKPTSMCLLQKPERKKYVKSNLSGQL